MRTKKEKIKLTIKRKLELTKEYIYNLTLSELIKCAKDNESNDNDKIFYKDDNIIIYYINYTNSITNNNFISIEPTSWDDYNRINIYFEDDKYRVTYYTFESNDYNSKIKPNVYKVSDFVKHTQRVKMKSSFIDKHFGRLKDGISTLRVYGYVCAKSLQLSSMYDLKCLHSKLNELLDELDYYKNKNALYRRHPNIRITIWLNIKVDKDFKRLERRIDKLKLQIKTKEEEIEEYNERIKKLKVKNYNYASESH